jgi:hypothetical protein
MSSMALGDTFLHHLSTADARCQLMRVWGLSSNFTLFRGWLTSGWGYTQPDNLALEIIQTLAACVLRFVPPSVPAARQCR